MTEVASLIALFKEASFWWHLLSVKKSFSENVLQYLDFAFFDTRSLWKSHRRHSHRSKQLSKFSSETLTKNVLHYIKTFLLWHLQFRKKSSETLAQKSTIVTIVIRDIVAIVIIVTIVIRDNCHCCHTLSQLSSETLAQLSHIVTIVIRDIVTAVEHCHNCHQRHWHSWSQKAPQSHTVGTLIWSKTVYSGASDNILRCCQFLKSGADDNFSKWCQYL